MPKRNFLQYLFHRPARRGRILPVKVYEEVAAWYFRCADWVACPDAAWFFAFDGNSGSQILVLSTSFAQMPERMQFFPSGDCPLVGQYWSAKFQMMLTNDP